MVYDFDVVVIWIDYECVVVVWVVWLFVGCVVVFVVGC